MTTFNVTVNYSVEADSRQQAEAYVQVTAVTPFRFSRRGTGRIVRDNTTTLLSSAFSDWDSPEDSIYDEKESEVNE